MKSAATHNEDLKANYKKAYQKTQELKSFYHSLILYLIIMSGLVYIWYEYSSNTIQWFWFPAIGWGLGLFFQGLRIYDRNILFGSRWEQNQIKRYMEKENT